jgi:large subunit ribosomal protein L24
MATKTKQARKQRKRLFNLSLHQKRKAIVAQLSKELRARFKRRNLPVRKGDKVKVMSGDFRGTEGEIMRVNLAEKKIYIDKVTVKKRDGTETLRAMRASNLLLTDIDIRDTGRQEMLVRKVGKAVVEEEVRKEEARMKKAEEERKAKEEAMKKADAEKKAEKEKKEEAKAAEAGEEKKEIRVSEKGIDEKIKKEWIAEK